VRLQKCLFQVRLPIILSMSLSIAIYKLNLSYEFIEGLLPLFSITYFFINLKYQHVNKKIE